MSHDGFDALDDGLDIHSTSGDSSEAFDEAWAACPYDELERDHRLKAASKLGPKAGSKSSTSGSRHRDLPPLPKMDDLESARLIFGHALAGAALGLGFRFAGFLCSIIFHESFIS